MSVGIVANTVWAIVASRLSKERVSRESPDAHWYNKPEERVVVFSYQRDFALLWGVGAAQEGLLAISRALWERDAETPLTVAIVWDGTPPQGDIWPLDTAGYLTPIDWAVGLSLSIEQERQKGTPDPRIRVLILDLASHRFTYAHGVRFAGLFPKRDVKTMPWVRLFRLVSGSEQEWDAGDFIASICGGDRQVPFMRESTQARQHDLESVRRFWEASLTHPAKAEDRHSITNLVGAQLLLEGMGERSTTQKSADITALVELMRAVGLVPQPLKQEAGPWYPPDQWKDFIESFVLLDDLAEQGWASFLAAALGLGDPPSKLRVFTEPMKAITDRDWSINLSEDDARKDVLFLDLRLFATMGKQEEREFFRSVLDAYGSFKKLPRAKQSWPWIGQREIAAIARYVAGQAAQETEDHYAALTLLPRLMALFKPWMPIILFSSTGQKGIVNRLESYKNIIVEFDKPRFFGQATDTVLTETKRRFLRAMTRAVAIARGRQVCNAILKQHVGHHQKAGNGSHVEIYLDESGSGRDIQVGGIAVIYPDKETCLNFWQTLRDNNLVWGYHRDDPWTAPQGESLPKASDIPFQERIARINSTLRAIEELAVNNGITIGSCTLGPLETPPGSLPANVAPDFYFRSLLHMLLEILLCDWLPQYAPHSTVAAYAGTRVASEQAFNRHPGQFLRLQRDFNIGMFLGDDRNNPVQATKHFDVVTNQDVQDNWNTAKSKVAFLNDKQRSIQLRNRSTQSTLHAGAYLFSFDDLYPIMLEILGTRSMAPRSGVSALGVQLVYPTARGMKLLPHQLPRQLHYVADYVVSCAEAIPAQWLERGFEDKVGDELTALLNASRHADNPQHHLDDALIQWELSHPRAHGQRSCARLIKEHLSEGVANMNAKLFIQFCDSLVQHEQQTAIAGSKPS